MILKVDTKVMIIHEKGELLDTSAPIASSEEKIINPFVSLLLQTLKPYGKPDTNGVLREKNDDDY